MRRNSLRNGSGFKHKTVRPAAGRGGMRPLTPRVLMFGAAARSAAAPLCGQELSSLRRRRKLQRRKPVRLSPAQGIEAEFPAPGGGGELERIARFLARSAKNAPNITC
jgi:hypothetical protein